MLVDLREITPLVDALSLSAHKFGGPKGVGVMMIKTGKNLEPLIFGGGQERDRRSGTHNVSGIIATAKALEVTDRTRTEETQRVTKLRDRLVDEIREQVDGVLERFRANIVFLVSRTCAFLVLKMKPYCFCWIRQTCMHLLHRPAPVGQWNLRMCWRQWVLHGRGAVGHCV